MERGTTLGELGSKGGSLKKKLRGDRISPGVCAVTGRGFTLNDCTERKKDT